MKSTNAIKIWLVPLGLACMASGMVRAADPVEELKACANVTEADARLACYDVIGEQLLQEEPAEPVAPPGEPTLPDHLGGADFEEQSGSVEADHRGLITACQEGAENLWYFAFNNGQVWRQSNPGRHRFRECQFPATITRDGFGYQMHIEMDDKVKRLRVRRIR